MQKVLLAKKKEKEDEKMAKAKIKAEIEADKKERAAKREAAKQAALIQQKEEAATAVTAASTSKEYSETRLQVYFNRNNLRLCKSPFALNFVFLFAVSTAFQFPSHSHFSSYGYFRSCI